MSSSTDSQLEMPGFNVPLNIRPKVSGPSFLSRIVLMDNKDYIFAHLGPREFGFPNALDSDHLASGRLE